MYDQPMAEAVARKLVAEDNPDWKVGCLGAATLCQMCQCLVTHRMAQALRKLGGLCMLEALLRLWASHLAASPLQWPAVLASGRLVKCWLSRSSCLHAAELCC